MAIYIGTAGNNTYDGTSSSDDVQGKGGDDVLNGLGGNDLLEGGTGNDILNGGDGNDLLESGAGIDTLGGGAGNDDIYAELGDTIDGGTGADTLSLDLRRMMGGLTADFGALFAGGAFTIGGTTIRAIEYVSWLQLGSFDDVVILGPADPTGPYYASTQIEGNAGNDRLTGAGGIDYLDGGTGNDVLNGQDGNDVIRDGPMDDVGIDTISGGAGNDTIYAGYGDTIDGGTGADTLSLDLRRMAAGLTVDFGALAGGVLTIGGATIRGIEYIAELRLGDYDDLVSIGPTTSVSGSALYGGGGNDTLTGGDGNNLIDGGAGIDVLKGGAGDDQIVAGFGDTVDGGTGTDVLSLDLRGMTGGLTANFGALNSGGALTIGGATIRGIEGLTRLDLGDHDDVVTIATSNGVYGPAETYGNGGNDQLTGTVAREDLYGGDGNDRLFGLAGADTLVGDAGDDLLDGGDDADYLIGGDGNDVVKGGAGDDYIRLTGGADMVDGGAGSDRIRIDYRDATAGITIDLRNLFTSAGGSVAGGSIVNVETVDVYGGGIVTTAFADTVFTGSVATAVSSSFYDGLELLGGNDTATGGGLADDFDGGDGDDTLDGGGGNDDLLGGNGNDMVSGGDGDDSGSGGDGDDTLDGGEGDDLVDGGDGDDTLSGGGGTDRLVGGSGDDTLSGGAGSDKLTGGLGDDVINGGDGYDEIIVTAGSDTVDGGAGGASILIDYHDATTGITIDLRPLATGGTGFIADGTAVNVEIYRYSSVTSTNFADTVFIGEFSTYYYHALKLLGGNDTATGGSLSDAFEGGDGDDTLIGNDGADWLSGGNGTDTLRGGAGDDELYGGNGDDLLNGDDGNDSLIAGFGNTVLNGGAGNDALLAVLSTVVDGGAGIDTVGINARYATAGLTIDFRDLWAGGTASIGDTTIVNVEGLDNFYLYGSNFDDIVFTGDVATTTGSTRPVFYDYDGMELLDGNDVATGGRLRDRFEGGNGDDILNGGGGNDALIGGAGNDVLRGGAGNDVLDGDFSYYGGNVDTADYADAAGAVTVTLETDQRQNTIGAGFDILKNIENLVGSAFDDTLTGSDGPSYNDIYYYGINTLTGLAGNDRLIGLRGDTAADIVTELAGEGVDEVRSSATVITLAANVENLTFTGSGAFAGTGNALANVLTGGAAADRLEGGDGNDRLDGRGGADRLIGGAGDDIYVIDDAGDRIFEFAGAGYDRVETALSYRLGAALEALVLTGSAAIDGVGNAGGNAITGNAAANVLNGLAGADGLSGGEGDDSLGGGSGADRIDGGAGADLIVGGAQQDVLTGGTGADRFAFFAGDTSADRGLADRIVDFRHADGDRIVLRAIDADGAAAGDQNFSFIGAAAFRNVAGELRAVVASGFTYVEGDVNGDGAADFSIRLDNAVTLMAGDFVL